jgi:hypothetical protein
LLVQPVSQRAFQVRVGEEMEAEPAWDLLCPGLLAGGEVEEGQAMVGR